jgi:uncharacterized protein with FMN-binding domain/DMSO/TMAO reductase YedYZ heme-binding membrane subunit
VQQYIIQLFTKGTLAAAFWAVVMWAGALPNGSPLAKKLMPQRGQLSIFTAILTLGHAVGLGISKLPRWIEKADALNLTVCIVLMLIMIPLTVISVQKIRRKMKASTWKAIQRTAYIFYALIPIHVIVLNIAKARNGRTKVLLNLMLYLVVFLGYAVCRVCKWYQTKKKPERLLGVKIASWAAFLAGMTIFAAAAYPKQETKNVQTANAEVQEESSQNPVTTAAVTTVTAAQSEAVTTTAADTSESDSTTDITTVTATEVTGETTAAEESSETEAEPAEAEETPEAPQEEAPAPQPEEAEAPAPVRIYQDGTFTASAFGYDGDIIVHVTIQDDRITDITAETAESDDSYFADAQSVVIPAIIRSQAADVDACSGATFSSNGIMAAVRTALESARI